MANKTFQRSYQPLGLARGVKSFISPCYQDLWKVLIRLKEEQLDEAEQPLIEKVKSEQNQKASDNHINYLPSQLQKSRAKNSSWELGAQDDWTS